MDKQILKNERVTLVNLEYGHVTVVIPKKLGNRFIYGTIVWKEQDGTDTERLTRDDKWELSKYKILPGARWDLLDLEHKHSQERNAYAEQRRRAENDAERKGYDLRDQLIGDWYKIHPEPRNLVLEQIKGERTA